MVINLKFKLEKAAQGLRLLKPSLKNVGEPAL